MVAETNRAPFDLPEAEAELVAGYNVEYSSIIFAMFFLGEYSNMIIMAALITILFCGGWSNVFLIDILLLNSLFFIGKILIFCYLYILIRASLPRYRYDQLMDIGWKAFLPVSLSFLWTLLILNLNCDINIYQHEILNNTGIFLNNFAFNNFIFLISNTTVYDTISDKNAELLLSLMKIIISENTQNDYN